MTISALPIRRKAIEAQSSDNYDKEDVNDKKGDRGIRSLVRFKNWKEV